MNRVAMVYNYVIGYQGVDLGAPPVVTPQYERIVGGATTSVTLSGLEPGTTYRIRVWSTDGTSVSSEAREMVWQQWKVVRCDVRMCTKEATPDSWSGIALGLSRISVHVYISFDPCCNHIKIILPCMVDFKFHSTFPLHTRDTSSCQFIINVLFSHNPLPTSHADHDWSTNWEYCWTELAPLHSLWIMLYLMIITPPN